MSMRHTGRWICNPGMRFGETRKLKWSYVDFENKILTVPRELTKRIDWNISNENDITEVTQLRIPLAGELLPV